MIEGKKVLAVTLARGGSQSIHKKNIAMIAGIPLIGYTIREAKKSLYIDKYVISTDDDEISDVSLSLDPSVEIIKRPDELSNNTASSASALIHAVDLIGHGFDYIVELMATNPFKNAQDIDGCIEKIHKTNADSVVAVVRIWDNHPSRLKYIEDDILMDFYPEIPESRRQDLFPASYVRNGSIYAMRREFLLKNKSRYDKKTRPYIMDEKRSINIDGSQELMFADWLLTGDRI
jgi:CMP-N,N'-diacetyllegionaminic acid synthase